MPTPLPVRGSGCESANHPVPTPSGQAYAHLHTVLAPVEHDQIMLNQRAALCISAEALEATAGSVGIALSELIAGTHVGCQNTVMMNFPVLIQVIL